jgi:dTDP-4-amino-4,6-dideoxygalactose transaminase
VLTAEALREQALRLPMIPTMSLSDANALIEAPRA